MSSSSSMRYLLLAASCWLALGGWARAQGSDEESSEEPAQAAESATNGEEAAETPSESSESSESASGGAPIARVQPFAGFGFGTRSFERPTLLGGQRLPTAYFPVADVGLGATLWPQARFSLAFLLRYQTSIGMQIEERPPFALRNQIGARSERVELSVAPTIKLSDDPQSLAFSFPIGLQARTLWPDVHESMTPGYSLIGPHLRAELLAPITRQLLLRIGPELFWIVAIDRSIRQDGVADQGTAIGGEAALQLELGSWFGFDLCYRESHAFASSNNAGPIFKDIERFVTARFLGTL